MAVGKMRNCEMWNVEWKLWKGAVEQWVKCVMRKFVVCVRLYVHGRVLLTPMNGRALYVSC